MSNLLVWGLIAKGAEKHKRGTTTQQVGYHPGQGAASKPSKPSDKSDYRRERRYTFKEIIEKKDSELLYACVKHLDLSDMGVDKVMDKVQSSMTEYIKNVVVKGLEELVEEKKQRSEDLFDEGIKLTWEFESKYPMIDVQYFYRTVIKVNDNEFELNESRILEGKNPIEHQYQYLVDKFPTIEDDIQKQKALVEKMKKHKFLLKISKKRRAKLREAEQKLADLEKTKRKIDDCKQAMEIYETIKEDIIAYTKQIVSLRNERRDLDRQIGADKKEIEKCSIYGKTKDKDYVSEAFDYALSKLSPEERELFEKSPELIYERLSTLDNETISHLANRNSHGKYNSEIECFVINYIYQGVLEYAEEKQKQQESEKQEQPEKDKESNPKTDDDELIK